MMSPVGFRNGSIKLDEPRDVYYSGQVLNGCVEFELEDTLTFSEITVEFKGEGNVFWSETQTEKYNGVKQCREVEYRGYEQYFLVTYCLAGGSGISQLPPGKHSLPFKYQIPHTAPSTFSGDIGSVTYCVTAYFKFSDPAQAGFHEELTKNFEVVAALDLNYGIQDIKRPIETEFEEMVSSCCVSSPLSVKIHIPVAGFCPGQEIPINLEIRNESSTEINKIIFTLVSRQRYRSVQPSSEYIIPEKVMATLKKGPVLGNSRRNYTFGVVVPDMIVPNLDNCNIIDVWYALKTTIKLSGCNDDLHDESEIFLGLVPLADFTSGEYVHPMAHSLPQAPLRSIRPPEFPQPIKSADYIEPTPNSMQTAYPHQAGLNLNPIPAYPAPSYPSDVPPYPSVNATELKPYHEFGFRSLEKLPGSNPPYPAGNTSFGPNPPYPKTDLMPHVQGHMQGSHQDLRIHLPPMPMSPSATAPSAPPEST